MNDHKSAAQAFESLLEIMDELREKCPWDRKQTLETLRHLTIEETYELSEAILDQDLQALKNELGDLLLHVVFYARIGSEERAFDMRGVIDHLCEKLIRRHPHIYGDTKVNDDEDVKQNWEAIKLREGAKSVLGGVPASLPALIKAWRIQEKVGSVGFEWDEIGGVLSKLREEMDELQAEIEREPRDEDRLADEMGDLLFSVVNLSRWLKVNPDEALERTNRKFIRRFQHIESRAAESGKAVSELSLAEMDVFWEEAKKG